ncbi:MAG TPA: ABC transporter permease [Anaerolineaceae bacterium]|nr:ABC transporter permease [Anaerolineaceae bacterium]
MKPIDIVVKDLKHIFTSVFSLVMMFGAPLFITGLLYFAFGGMAGEANEFTLPVTRVQVVNLDQPGTQPAGFAAGQMLVDFLQDESLADVLAVSLAADEAAARTAVDRQQAGVAVIIPENFTAAVTAPDQTAAVRLYQDPALNIGPGIVKDLVSHFMDGFSGAKIAGQVTAQGLSAAGISPDPALNSTVAQQYTAWQQSSGHGEGQAVPRLSVVAPTGETQPGSESAALFGPVMAGMLVFFVFFMGANGAESIIHEDEQGTLARLFSTPTRLSSILSGKFFAVVVTLTIQIVLLLLASSLLFGIHWGRPEVVILVSIGLVVVSAGFGTLLMSFVKTSRQTGPVLGGVMTLTGMLGGLFTTGIPNVAASFDRVTLAMPQGWALQGWKLALSGAGIAQVLVPVLVMLALGLIFLALGVTLFRKRYA